MKKSFLLLFVFVLALVLSACLQPISEVTSFTISGWTAKEYYDIDDVDGLWNDNVTLDVVYDDGAEESLDLGTGIEDQTVVISGDYAADPLGLKTDSKGYYSVTITVGDISLSFTYYVFDLSLARNVPSEYATIGAALSGAPDNTVVFVADGTYAEALSVSNVTGLTIFGESREGVIINSSNQSGRAFQSSGTNGLALVNLTFTDAYTVGGGSGKRFMVKISSADDIVIRNVTIQGPGKNFLNSADMDGEPATAQPVGGLDLNTVTNATVANVSASDFSRNAMSFSSVIGLVLEDFEITNAGQNNSGWAALALYVSNTEGSLPTTLIEATGTIHNANIGINYSVAPYADFEFGNIVITFGGEPGVVEYPLFLGVAPGDGSSIDKADDFALNVTGLAWRVSFTDLVSGGTALVYFPTQEAADAFVTVLAGLTITGTAENITD
jgi:hypothetical protein